MNYKQALDIAKSLQAQLAPHCLVVDIAGSIRREKTEVNDIEICCIPKKVTAGASDLFGDGPRREVHHPHFISVASSFGNIQQGRLVDGRNIKIKLPQGITLDLFAPLQGDYYRIFAIRTGSADYSRLYIASAWRKRGFVGTADGLRLEKECKNVGTKEHPRWQSIKAKPYVPQPWRSEEDFFDWLNLKWIIPRLRSI